MPSVNLQFHMLFDELVQFVAEVASKNALAVELERWFPKTTHEVVVGGDLVTEVHDFGRVDRFLFLYKPKRARRVQKFVLNVGRQKGKYLEESQLGAGTDNLEAFTVLKKIAADLKRCTTVGMWVVTCTGNAGYTKLARKSEGAALASRTGRLELTAIGFTQRFFPDQPT